MGRERGRAGLDGRAAVLVLVEDPERQAAPPAEVVAALYGLLGLPTV